MEPRSRGKGIGERSQKNPPARTRREKRETTIHIAELLSNAAPEADAGTPGATSTLPELASRLRRLRSARSSAALWQRTSRSFSRVFSMMRWKSGGRFGFKRTGGTGLL